MRSTLDIGTRRLVTMRHGFQVLANQFNQLIADPPKDRDDLTVAEKRERRVSLDHLLADLSRYQAPRSSSMSMA